MAGRWQGLAFLPLLALAACAGEADRARDGSSADDPILSANSPVALTPYWPEGGAANITGRLVLEDGCLYLRDADGERVLPTFPWPGSHWDSKTATVSIFGRYRFRVGQLVTAGGGFATSQGDDSPSPEALQQMLVQPRPRCDTTRVAVLYFGTNRDGG